MCNKTVFFINLCLQNVKSYRFVAFFCQFLLDFKKKHCKISISAHFSKQKLQKMTFLEIIIWSKLEVIIWSKLVRLKKRQLGPDNHFQFFCAQFFPPKCAETTNFIVFFCYRCFRKKTNLDQIITSKTPKLGPDNNSTAYIYIYIYFFLSYFQIASAAHISHLPDTKDSKTPPK